MRDDGHTLTSLYITYIDMLYLKLYYSFRWFNYNNIFDT